MIGADTTGDEDVTQEVASNELRLRCTVRSNTQIADAMAKFELSPGDINAIQREKALRCFGAVPDFRAGPGPWRRSRPGGGVKPAKGVEPLAVPEASAAYRCLEVVDRRIVGVAVDGIGMAILAAVRERECGG